MNDVTQKYKLFCGREEEVGFGGNIMGQHIIKLPLNYAVVAQRHSEAFTPLRSSVRSRPIVSFSINRKCHSVIPYNKCNLVYCMILQPLFICHSPPRQYLITILLTNFIVHGRYYTIDQLPIAVNSFDQLMSITDLAQLVRVWV